MTAKALADLVLPQSSSPNLGQKDWNSTFRTECHPRASARYECPGRDARRAKATAGDWPYHQRLLEALRPPFREPLAALPWPTKFLAWNWRDEAHVSSPQSPLKAQFLANNAVMRSRLVPMQ